jgi:hypothetical protein
MTNANPSEEREPEAMNDRQLDLLGADYRRILELLMQMNDEGKDSHHYQQRNKHLFAHQQPA